MRATHPRGCPANTRVPAQRREGRARRNCLHLVRRGGASALTRDFLSILQTVRSDKIFYEQISVWHIDVATFRPTAEAFRASICYLIGIVLYIQTNGGVQERHDDVTSRDFMSNTFLEELPVGDTYIQTHSQWRPFHGNNTVTVEDSIGSPYALTNM